MPKSNKVLTVYEAKEYAKQRYYEWGNHLDITEQAFLDEVIELFANDVDGATTTQCFEKYCQTVRNNHKI